MKDFRKCLKYAFLLSPSLCIATLVYSIAVSGLPFVVLLFSGRIVDQLLSGAEFSEVMVNVYFLAFCGLGLGLVALVSEEIVRRKRRHVYMLLDHKLFMQSFNLPYDVFEKDATCQMLLKARDGSNGSGSIISFVQNAFGRSVSVLASLIYSMFLISGAWSSIESSNQEPLFLFLNSPFSILVIFALIALAILTAFFLGKWQRKFLMSFFDENVEANRATGYLIELSDQRGPAKDIRVYGLEDLIDHRFEETAKKLEKTYNVTARKSALNDVLFFLPTALVLVGSYFYVSGKAYYGIVSIGSIITIVGGLSSFSTALLTGASAINSNRLMTGYLKYFFEYLELDSKPKGGEKAPRGELKLAFEHVYYAYEGAENYAVEDLSFELTPGKKTALVGPNGAGKSTIIKLISRLYSPNKGKITLNGVDISAYDEKEYNALLAILFQDFSLFPFTLGQNVASSLEYDQEKALSCLKQSGFELANGKFPDGLDTLIASSSNNGKELSGGESQKIAIARALYKDPPFILLDEPTSALDPKSEAEVYESISKLVGGRTSLFISHRMSSTKFCDEIIVLNEGKLSESGTHEELLKANGLYAKMFMEQAKYYL